MSDVKKQLAAFGEFLEERYGEVVETELQSPDQAERMPPSRRRSHRGLSLLAGAGAVVTAFAVVFVLLPGGSGPANTPPPNVALAEEYVEARNSGDIDLVLSLMSEDVEYEEGWSRQTIAGMLRWQHAIGQTLSVDCAADSERATGVICHGTFTTDLDQALGFDECAQLLLFEIQEGKIVRLVDGGTCDQDWDEPFLTWIRENHPDDEALMYDLDDITRFQMFLNPASIDLWERHVAEFAMETSG